MSHVTKVDVRIRDLDALEKALPPELELRRGQTTHAWWGRFEGDSTPPAGREPEHYGRCEHAIGYRGIAPRNGSTGEWEIGLVSALDGDGYDMLVDSYGGPGRKLTQHLPHIKREYAAETVMRGTAMAKLSRQGWRAMREDLPGNQIRIKLVRR